MNNNKLPIGIIGFGKVGGSLGFALHKLGFQVLIYSRSIPNRPVTPRFTFSPMKQLIEKNRIIFIAVPDKKILTVARNLAHIHTDLTNKIIFHTSGAKTSNELRVLKKQGASIASFHPLQTFPHAMNSLSIWKNVYCVLEGDRTAIKSGKDLCKKLQMKSLVLPAQKKIYYHSAAVFASNFLVLLIQMSRDLALLAGIDKNKYKSLFSPLIAQSLNNILNKEMNKALSGPLVRKDFHVMRTQINAIKKINKDLSRIYTFFIKYYQHRR